MNEVLSDQKLCFKENVESFITQQFKLLETEREAEIEENRCLLECVSLKKLQKKGLCLPKLRASQISTGLFGRIVVKLSPSFSSDALPSHSISSGDIVGIGNLNADGKFDTVASGVVSNVHECYLTIALEKDFDSSDLEYDEIYSVIKLANDVTYKRLKRILKTLENESGKIPLVNVLFGYKIPSSLELDQLENLEFCNQNLNDTQKEAVKFAISQKEVAILHGPPGTGKTTTLVECILQSVSQKCKVIACAPSNIAVDNLVEKLSQHKVKIVRLGHPARSLTSIQKYSLDAIVSQYDGSDVIDEMQTEMSKLKSKIENAKKSASRKSLWAENKTLLKEMKERQKAIVKQILTNADVVLSTLTSASADSPLKHLEEKHFDVCYIDECSQSLETACWIPLALVKKCVIAGDHNQLPPTIISEEASKQGLSVTLMERLLKLHGESIKKMLTLQYRMHEVIMRWPSKQLYENKLTAHESVQSHLLCDLPGVESNENTMIPLLLIDTSGCNLCELQSEDEESKGNEGEADLVLVHVESLIRSGVGQSDIAIISPYNLQVDLIKTRCSTKYPKVEIKSVDGFQGREKEAVILSLVRSNEDGEVGFLTEDRRINVAITRAKRHLATICDSATVSHSSFLKSFVEYCEENGEVRSAFQYENQIGQYPIATKQASSKAKQSKPKAKKKVSPSNIISAVPEDSKKYLNKEENEIKRVSVEEKMRQIIQNFHESGNDSFQFSSDLSAFERKIVHEVAEEIGLNHVSQGEGAERFIVISKHVPEDTAFNSKLPSCEATEPKTVYVNNNTNDIVKRQNSSGNQKNKSSKSRKAEPKPSLPPKEETEEDFDALLEKVVKADKTCSFHGCKKCVTVIAQVCSFCKGRFCFSHFIPEAHGCGHQAKLHARSQIRKEGAIYAGSGKPEKKVDSVKRSFLQKKLNEKISTMTGQRKIKPKS